MKNICVVTGTRAEYGLLKPVMEKVQGDAQLNLQIIVTGSHLSPEFGMTHLEIEKDGFRIDEKVEILMSSDSPIGISKSMGLALISFSEVLERLKPDLLVVLGDRYEIYAVASAAHISRIPMAHISGGEITEGALDDVFRHCITKMSHLHFVANEIYRRRVIQLGEEPDRVFNVGDIGVENIMNLNLLSQERIEEICGFNFDSRIALLTYHPVTLGVDGNQESFNNLLEAIDSISNLKVIFTKANADTDGRVINQMIDDYVYRHPQKAVAFASMGQINYLSAMKYCSFVIGNSSSGIVEAPVFKKPSINIGERQKGRMKAASVVDCGVKREEIVKCIDHVLSDDFANRIQKNIHPYGDGKAVSWRIVERIRAYVMGNIGANSKRFYDL